MSHQRQCRAIESDIIDILGKALPEKRATEVDRHLRECAECRRLLEEIRTALDVETREITAETSMDGISETTSHVLEVHRRIQSTSELPEPREITFPLSPAGECQWTFAIRTGYFPLFECKLFLRLRTMDGHTKYGYLLNRKDRTFVLAPPFEHMAAGTRYELSETAGTICFPDGQTSVFELAEVASGGFRLTCPGLPEGLSVVVLHVGRNEE